MGKEFEIIPARTRASRRNLQKANEARALKLRERKLQELDEAKQEVNLARLDRKRLKEDFLKVFYLIGGISAVEKWAKKDPKNRTEYYRLMASMLKSDAEAQAGSRPMVSINFIGMPAPENIVPVSTQEPSQ